jgi:hypothetical protein
MESAEGFGMSRRMIIPGDEFAAFDIFNGFCVKFCDHAQTDNTETDIVC